jgi:hypothetical protein
VATKRRTRVRRTKQLTAKNLTGVPKSEADRAFVRRALNEFLERELGEEMARVCRLPYKKRFEYIADMIDHAESKGVKFDKPATGVTR